MHSFVALMVKRDPECTVLISEILDQGRRPLESGPWAAQASGHTHSGPLASILQGLTALGAVPPPGPWVLAGATGVSGLLVRFLKGTALSPHLPFPLVWQEALCLPPAPS